MQETCFFSPEQLKSYVRRFLASSGVPQADAAITADVLVAADLRGVQSHGIIRLHTYYGDRISRRLIDPLSPITSIRETPVSAVLDGRNGLGPVVAHHAMVRCGGHSRAHACRAGTQRRRAPKLESRSMYLQWEVPGSGVEAQ